MKRLVVIIMLTIMGSLTTNLFQPQAGRATVFTYSKVLFGGWLLKESYSFGTQRENMVLYDGDVEDPYNKKTLSASATKAVLIKENGPETFVSAHFTCNTGHPDMYAGVNVESQIIYEFVMEKNDPDYPDLVLPLMIEISAEVEAYNETYAFAYVTLIWGPFGYYWGYEELINLDQDNPQPYQNVVALVDIPVGSYNRIGITVSLADGAGWELLGYTFSSGRAKIDPLVYIDPTYMVEYNGTMVPAASMYSVKFPDMPTTSISPYPNNPGALFLLLDD